MTDPLQIEGLHEGPIYFFLKTGAYSKSIAQVNLVTRVSDGHLLINVIYSPTWNGIKSHVDLNEETWFAGDNVVEQLVAHLREHDAVRIAAATIPNWVRYFEGGDHQWFDNEKVAHQQPLAFALATWSLQDLLAQLGQISLEQSQMSWLAKTIALRRFKSWTSNIGFIVEMHDALALRGLALAVVPIDKTITVSENWDVPSPPE